MAGRVTGLPRGAGRPLPPRCRKALLRYRGCSGFSHRARILVLILPATGGIGQGRRRNDGSFLGIRGVGRGKSSSEAAVHRMAMSMRMYVMGMGVVIVLVKPSITYVGTVKVKVCSLV